MVVTPYWTAGRGGEKSHRGPSHRSACSCADSRATCSSVSTISTPADEGVGEPDSGRCGLGLVEGAAGEEAAVFVLPANPSVRLTHA